jgi:hypothetical protein
VDNETILLSESFGWMDIFDVLALGMIGSGGGGGTQPRPSLISGALRTP